MIRSLLKLWLRIVTTTTTSTLKKAANTVNNFDDIAQKDLKVDAVEFTFPVFVVCKE